MIERRPFGRTGHHSTVTLFGAAALARVDQDAADRALEVLLLDGVEPHRYRHADDPAVRVARVS